MTPIALALLLSAPAADPKPTDRTDIPRPVAATRPEMKELIEEMKLRKPRIPLLDLTEEDKAKLGDRGIGYEARLRYHYMPAGDARGGGGGGFGLIEKDTEGGLDYAFKVQLFWIVCRANNCQYCQGHQEGKLLRAGQIKPLLKAQVSWIIARQDRAWYATGIAKKRLLGLGQSEDQIYRLDGDWKSFTDSERSLFTDAKKLAASPVVLTDDDVTAAIKAASARDVVQLITYVTTKASFDRITEAAGLQLEK